MNWKLIAARIIAFAMAGFGAVWEQVGSTPTWWPVVLVIAGAVLGLLLPGTSLLRPERRSTD